MIKIKGNLTMRILALFTIALMLAVPALAFESVPGLRYYQNSYSSDDQTGTVVRTPATGSNISVWGYQVSADVITTFTWILTDAERGGSTANGARHHIISGTTATWEVGNAPAFTGDTNQPLSFTFTTADGIGNVGLTVVYQEIP